jgi:hypothetical protein
MAYSSPAVLSAARAVELLDAVAVAVEGKHLGDLVRDLQASDAWRAQRWAMTTTWSPASIIPRART